MSRLAPEGVLAGRPHRTPGPRIHERHGWCSSARVVAVAQPLFDYLPGEAIRWRRFLGGTFPSRLAAQAVAALEQAKTALLARTATDV